MFQHEDWRELEGDLMHNCVKLPSDASAAIECVEGKPGFIRFLYDPLYSKYFTKRPLCNKVRKCEPEPDSNSQTPQTRYINPMIMKNNMNKLVDEINPVYMQMVGNLILGRPIIVDRVETANTETTAEQNIYFKEADGSLIVHVSIDQVPSVRLNFWPQQAANWITRSRCWPLQDDIQGLVANGCQVVPRSSPGGDINSEWRLSFSIPEVTLAKLRSLDQQRAYYLFKIIFYQHLKSVESSEAEKKSLYSYVMKTTMLWVCEEYPPTHPVWRSLEDSVKMLLSRLVDGLQDGKVPHYFLPEINLIERVGDDVIDFCIGKIMNLQDKFSVAIPTVTDERLDNANLLLRLSALVQRIVPKWLENECNFLALIPELLSILAQMK